LRKVAGELLVMENILLFVIQRRPRFDEGVVVVVQSLDDDV
jgi:hypothetical protein